MARIALFSQACRPSRVTRPCAATMGGAEMKTIHLMRHACTEMNVYLATHRWDAPGFVDPKLYDTKLTETGEKQAQAQQSMCSRLRPAPQLLVCSPMRRALRTAELAFSGLPATVPRVVTALCRERLYHSSDVGRSPQVMRQEFPGYAGWEQLPEVWWHAAADPPDPLAHDPEPEDAFLERCRQFTLWLAARPEASIAVVTHWGVIEALTQIEFSNVELRTYRLQDLQVRRPRELVPPG